MVDGFDEDIDVASVLVPVDIINQAGVLQSVTANGVALPEDTNPAWNSATTYTLGQRVHSPVTHRVYESLKSDTSNVNKDPTLPANQQTAAGVGTYWLDVGPTNKYSMFDGIISTQSVATGPVVITLRPGAANGFAIFGIDADTISAVSTDAPGGNVVYTTGGDVTLEGSMPADWYEYFYSPFKPLTQFQVTGIDAYGASELVITLKKTTGMVRIGMIAVGDVKPLGTPEKNTRVAPKTNSYIADDAYGNTTIKRRAKSRPMTMQIKVGLEDADDVIQTIEDLIDIPVAFIGSTAQFHTKLSTFGLISGEMDYSTYPDRTLSLSVKGFI